MHHESSTNGQIVEGSTSQQQTAQCRLVIIDDDYLSLYLTKNLAHTYVDTELEIDSFSDSRTAMAHLKNLELKEPLRIFLDIHMPRMNGWELLEIFKEIFPDDADVKVVLQSVSISRQDMLKATKYKIVQGIVTKPMTPFEIKKLLNS